MMRSLPTLLLLLHFISCSLLVSCSKKQVTTIQGELTTASSGDRFWEIYIEQPPIHYKYAEKIIHPVDPDGDGSFSVTIPSTGREVVRLYLDETFYPLVIAPGQTLTLDLDSRTFPLNVQADAEDTRWNQLYQQYLEEVIPLEAEIENDMDAFRNAEPNRVLDLYRKRINLSEKYLTGTDLESVFHANIGEYLNRALQNISYLKKHDPQFNPDSARSSIFDFAREHDFFSLKSQKAQRAGIRDFAHNYAMSFQVQDSLRAIHGDQLSDQDIKRLGYDQLNAYREQVIEEIGDEDARAYAEMHLVAKRLGEMSLQISEASLSDYLETYPGYEEYTDFLLKFHSEMTTVEPGQPAVPFTLPDPDGNRVSMADFDNRYILLDFWASWCVPCLDEFPHMKRIYENTSRDEFEIVAISTEEDSLAWRRALQEFDNPWVQLYGGDGFQQETFVSYRGGGIPFYILINPEGEIERYNDIRATHNLESVLDSLLTTQPPPQ